MQGSVAGGAPTGPFYQPPPKLRPSVSPCLWRVRQGLFVIRWLFAASATMPAQLSVQSFAGAYA